MSRDRGMLGLRDSFSKRFASTADATRHRATVTRRQRVSVLQTRLQEALVFEMYQDGRREYRTMTLRELYNHVLKAIATRPGDTSNHDISHKILLQKTVLPPRGRKGSIDVPSVLDYHEHGASFVSSLGGGTDRNGSSDLIDDDKASEQQQGEQKAKKVTFERHKRSVSGSGQPCPITGNITYRERLGGYLHPRDMRRLVTPFSSSNAPEVMVRRHVILLNCDPLRAIVLRDRLLVLVPDGADSILEKLAKRIGESRTDMEDSVFGESVDQSSHHSKTLSSSHSKDMSSHKPKKTHKGHLFDLGWEHEKKDDKQKVDSKLSDQPRAFDAGDSDVTVEETSSQSDEGNVEDEWEEMQGRAWIDLPFELQAVDAVLHTVSIMLLEDVDTMQESVYSAIEELLERGRASIGDLDQQILRATKNNIKELSSRIMNFVRALNGALDDEEDLALMNLSRLITHPERFIQPVPQEVLGEESDEPELILETHMQQALSTANQLDLLSGQVDTAEQLMMIQMDTVRNRLLYVNTVLSVLTLTVSMASLVGSIFGMNLANHLEDEPRAFIQVTFGTLGAALCFLFMVMVCFRKAGTLPRFA